MKKNVCKICKIDFIPPEQIGENYFKSFCCSACADKKWKNLQYFLNEGYGDDDINDNTPEHKEDL
jgi:hypothetical protein